MRHRSRLIRLLLGLTALATVWCLGCGAFDPVLTALFPGAGATMVCASEASASGAIAKSAGNTGSAVVALTASHDAGSATSCGCDSCHAPAPSQLAVVAPTPILPHPPASEPTTPPSIGRAPLVPPPQRGA